LATIERKELKKKSPVFYVLFRGETAFGFFLMPRLGRVPPCRSVSAASCRRQQSPKSSRPAHICRVFVLKPISGITRVPILRIL
jgi:hypothetical protein